MKSNNRQFVSVFILFVLIFSQFAFPKPAAAAHNCGGISISIYYVDMNAPIGGIHDGCGWSTAFLTLQDALTQGSLASGDTIRVADGTYYPDEGGGQSNDDRNATFNIPNGVSVYGGYAGYGAALPDLRDPNPNTNNTVLSGDIDHVNDFDENAYHVVSINGVGNTTVLDGFTITKGNANHIAGVDGYGGGINIYNSNVTLNNLLVTDNLAGETVGSGGGGIYIDGPITIPLTKPIISNVTFSYNESGRGGGLFSQRSSPELTNVIFIGNKAVATGGGGANFQTLQPTDPYINPILTNVSFINNTATGGGGMFLGTSSGSLTNVTFSGNTATRRGGGLLLEFSTAVLTNVTFYNNTSTNTAGVAPKGGGGLMILSSSPTLNNVTFSGNVSNANGVDGGAVRVARHQDVDEPSNPVIRNSIFWDNNSTEITHDGSGTVTITINDSVVEGGCPIDPAFNCTNVINADPLLGVLASNGGFTQTMALGTGSPAINAGNNSTCASTDQRGVTRPQGSACDMGAYELEMTLPAFVDTTVADFTSGTLGDCVVDAGVGNGALKLALPQTSCQFVSRVFDAGDLVDWIGLDWTGTTSTEATITMAVRTGNADGTWTNWQADRDPLNNFGGQYIQYQATLTTTDSGQTPVLEEVTLNYVNKAYAVLQAPVGTLTDWDHVFRWTGRASATNYLLEVYKPDNTFALWKWYTAAQAGCAGGTECSITPAETLNLANGEYKWRVADYDTTDGYGIITNLSNFTLSGACYTLTKDVNPSGSGAVTASAVNCAGGYTAGTVVQVTVVPTAGYVFTGWSGDAGGSAMTTTVTMDGDKSVRANLRGNTLISPVGTLTSWNNVFSWTGHAAATHYMLEVRKADNTLMLQKWYTAAQAGCAGGSACTLSPVQLAGLANGDYIWVIRDYGAYGYGAYTPAKPFSLNAACYTLTTSASPSVGGNVTTSAVNCEGGYTAGTVVQVSVVPSVGYVFTGWSGGGTSGTSLTTSVTMDGDKSVTANLRGNTLISPVGTLTTWNNVFSWTGHAEATHYLLEVYKADNTFALWKWYTAEQAGCAGGSACSLSPVQLAGLANGDYKWRILDYGAYGYGAWTPLMNFTLP